MTLKGVSGSLGGGALLLGAVATTIVSVPGAQPGNAVSCSPNTYPGDSVDWCAWVSSNDTVTVRIRAVIAVTPTASTYSVWVHQ
jgi:hypothetical protein